LRLEALAGDRFERASELQGWATALDDPREHAPANRPAPVPPADLRPRLINVTEVDRLKADPFAFYAARILKLRPLDTVDADPNAAWRGTAVHDVLERWARAGAEPDTLRPLALEMMRDERTHPLVRALWWPRLQEGIDWIVRHTAANRAAGRDLLAVEGTGRADLAGVTLQGRFDRIDRLPDGGIAVVDYKTGKPPSTAAVREGFSLQLGLLGLIAERGGFEHVSGTAGEFEYWSLGKKGGQIGYRESPADPEGKRDKIVTSEFVARAAENFTDVADCWLTGGRRGQRAYANARDVIESQQLDLVAH
jgi:ATP-dependent helicase/nuclease subunit B